MIGRCRGQGFAVQVERLSQHLVRRWIQRLGVAPSLESVNLILRNGQITKRGRDLFRIINGRMYPFQTLTEVWNHNEGLLLWIDERRATAVTVIIPRNREERGHRLLEAVGR